ncbi:MAG: hypothetical protein ACO3ZZ_03615, partial [Solirubrobacterales bacterium]
AGLAPVGAVLAAFAGRARDRALLAVAALATAAGAEAISGRKFLFGDMPKAGAEWSESPLTLVTELIWQVVTAPAFPVALGVWVAVAVAGGFVIHRLTGRTSRPSGRLEPSGVGSESVTDVR